MSARQLTKRERYEHLYKAGNFTLIGPGGGGGKLSEISYTYDPPIYDITSGWTYHLSPM